MGTPASQKEQVDDTNKTHFIAELCALYQARQPVDCATCTVNELPFCWKNVSHSGAIPRENLQMKMMYTVYITPKKIDR